MAAPCCWIVLNTSNVVMEWKERIQGRATHSCIRSKFQGECHVVTYVKQIILAQGTVEQADA